MKEEIISSLVFVVFVPVGVWFLCRCLEALIVKNSFFRFAGFFALTYLTAATGLAINNFFGA